MGNLFFGLNIGRSAMLANQAALDVSGHNLANVQTEGYSRQRAALEQSLPVQAFQHTFGSGVEVEQVQRLQLGWVERQINRVEVQHGYDAASRQALQELQSLLAEPSAEGLGSALSDFFNSWDALSLRPTDSGLRAQVLEQGAHLATTYNQRIEALTDAEDRFDESVADGLDEVNTLTAELADLNAAIAKAAAAGRNANDLQDQRDRLVSQITEKAGVEVEADGAYLNLKLSGGPYLVSRVHAFEITAGRDDRGHLADFRVGSGPVNLAGGELGALVEARDEVSPDLRSELATLMSTVSDRVNGLHAGAYDRNGLPGLNFFGWEGTADTVGVARSSGISEVAVDASLEPGTHHLEVESVDASLVPNGRGTLPAGRLTLQQTGGTYAGDAVLNRDYHVRVVAPNGDPTSLDGMRVQLFRGSEAVGEAQELSGAGPATVTWPGVDGVDFAATVDPGAGFAFSPGGRSDGLATTGTVSMDGGGPVPVDLTAMNDIPFLGGGERGFLAGGGATVTFSGEPFAGAGFTVYGAGARMRVNPAVAADTNRVAASQAPGATGDGEVARQLGELATGRLFEETGETAAGYLGRTVQSLGARGREAEVFEEASGSILLQLQSQREGVSGVNVDEEMVLLIQYQRGFQAAARFLTTVDGLIETLVNGVGR